MWGVLGVGVPVIALVLIFVLYFRYGREPKTQFQAQYLRDFPEPQLPPALAAFIWRMGSVGSDDVTATLLDLVNRKVIDLERVVVQEDGLFGSKETTTYKLTLHDERLEELLDYERQLCKFLFHQMADGNELVLSELKEIAKTHRTSFAKGFQTWKNKVEKEGEQRGYLDPQADRMAFTASAFAFVAIVAAGAAAIFSGFWWFFLGVPVGIVLIFVATGGQASLAGGRGAARPVRGPRALPQGLRPARREAAGRHRAVGAVPRLRGGVRHRRPGGEVDDRQGAGSRERPGLPHAVHPVVGDAR